MNSWDCFDTLVARRFVHPHTIFDEVGRRLGVEQFTELRQIADAAGNIDKTYQGIYKRLPGIDANIEFQVELEHCFGITENINKVKDGDIIVSDMYLSENQIKQILVSCGLKKDVKIFVTPNGKSSGTIWEKLPKIDLHTGDNYNSDIVSPNRHGIPTAHYTGHLFNDVEQFVSKFDYELACWMRYVRLQCPYIGEEQMFWVDQSNLNLPVLALASLALPNKTIAFTYRDSIYWQPLYEKITGKTAKRLDVSRLCYNNPTLEFTEYVLTQSKDSVIVDLYGSGKSIKSFFKDNIVDVIFICGDNSNPFTCLSRGNMGDSIEKHNCSSEGTLIGWNNNGPIRKECEHDLKIVEIQSGAMAAAVKSSPFFRIKQNNELLSKLIYKMTKNFTDLRVNKIWHSTHN